MFQYQSLILNSKIGWSYEIRHVIRNINFVVDDLACLSLSCNLNLVFFEQVPPSYQRLLTVDIAEVNWLGDILL